MSFDRDRRRGPSYNPSRGPDGLVNFEIRRDYAPHRDESVLRVMAEVSTGRHSRGDDPRDTIDQVVCYLRDQLFEAHGFRPPGGIPDRRHEDRRMLAEMAAERDHLRGQVRRLEAQLSDRIERAVAPPMLERMTRDEFDSMMRNYREDRGEVFRPPQPPQEWTSLFDEAPFDESKPNPKPEEMLATQVQIPVEIPPKRKMILE